MYFWDLSTVPEPLHLRQKLTIIQYSGKDELDEISDHTCKYGKQWYFKTNILNSTTETWYTDKCHE